MRPEVRRAFPVIVLIFLVVGATGCSGYKFRVGAATGINDLTAHKTPLQTPPNLFMYSGVNSALVYSGPIEKGGHLTGELEVFTTGLLSPIQDFQGAEMRSISLGAGAIAAIGMGGHGIETSFGFASGVLSSLYDGTLSTTYNTLEPVSRVAFGAYQGVNLEMRFGKNWQWIFWSKDFYSSSTSEYFRGNSIGMALRYGLGSKGR